MTPRKTVGLKRKNDGGPKNPTVLTMRDQVRNAVNGSKARRKQAPITLAPVKFGKD